MRLLLILFLVGLKSLNAQSITGRVVDEQRQTIANATVSLLRMQDSMILRTALTSSKGEFSFAGPDSQRYLLLVSATGFTPKYHQPDTLRSEIQLTRLSTELAGVVVSSRKPIIEIQGDRLVFNVEGSINGTGSNGLELLQKSPGVIVDKDDNIILSGKNGVRIYIDNKPSPLRGSDLAAYLRSLNSNDIEAIEIITNPSARYDAEGNAGIINFRLKKNKNLGLNGSVTGGYGIGIYSKYNAGMALNFRSKKINLYTNYSGYDTRNENRLNLFRIQNGISYDQKSSTFSHSVGQNLKTGIDIFISSKSTLGILVIAGMSDTRFQRNSITPIRETADNDIDRVLTAKGDSKAKRQNITSNINYKYSDSIGRFFSLDLDQGSYRLRNNGITPNVYTEGLTNNVISTYTFSTETPTNIDLVSAKADYEQNFLQGRIAVGLKSSRVKTTNDFQFYNYDVDNKPAVDEARSNQFSYSELIYAAYAQYQRKTGKLEYQLGIRLENTSSAGILQSNGFIEGKNVKRRYLDLFPAASLNWNLNSDNSFGVSYSRRIDRPRYQDLNPFENKIDELSYQKGNPFLKPQYTNIYELRHTYKYKLTTALSYSDVHDFFAQVSDTIEGKRSFIMQRNLANQKIVSFNVSYPFNVTKWWSVYANITVYHSRYRAVFEQQKTIKLDVTVGSVYQQQTFNLGKKWSAEVSGFFNSPSIWAGTYKTKSIWTLDGGLQKKFWNENATVKVSVTDIFFTSPWAGTSRFGGLYIAASGRWESRQLKMNFTYRFGNTKVKASRSRKTGLEELNNRVN